MDSAIKKEDNKLELLEADSIPLSFKVQIRNEQTRIETIQLPTAQNRGGHSCFVIRTEDSEPAASWLLLRTEPMIQCVTSGKSLDFLVLQSTQCKKTGQKQALSEKRQTLHLSKFSCKHKVQKSHRAHMGWLASLKSSSLWKGVTQLVILIYIMLLIPEGS